MKQNVLISIYQVVAVVLCTCFIFENVGAEIPLKSVSLYISLAMLALNILVIALCWKRFGLALRFRITEAILLIASAFTPLVSYYTFIGDNTVLPVATSKLVLLYAMGQVSWCLAVYILPDLVGKLREKRY